MIIKDMFAKDIDRDIKGVIKVGQNDDANIRQELEEYVVTKELQKHFRDFFESYKNGIHAHTDKMGVWISGFFGSGKSHFLKILSYLLENRVVDGKAAIDYFIDDHKIQDELVLADMRLAANTPSDVILFNIDSRSDTGTTKGDKEEIVNVFLKVFNEHLGYYGANPQIADFERNLDEEGKFPLFKETFLKIRGQEWEKSRHTFRFIRDKVVQTLVEAQIMSEEAANSLCNSMTEPYRIDIVTFAKMIRDYIQSKGKDHHVVFLIDEVGQYISENTNLMLGLQSITENLGTECQGKAWVVVTGQQDIDSITKTKGNDFSKIQGRFDTRLSLSSANVDEVIRQRILKKNEAGNQTLRLYYDEKETIIKNLILFNDNVYKKLYRNRDDFAYVYPFVPYQFDLMGHVLTSIREHGASGKHLSDGERSLLALFKESAVKVKMQEEGAVVPFHLFYDELEKYLDHSHYVVIRKAGDNEYLNEFDVDVLKTLFMVKYVKEIEANAENITTLLITDIDQDRRELKEKVEASLKRLLRQTLIQKNGEKYIFLTNEEQEINREIANQSIEESEVKRKVSEMIYDELYTEKTIRMGSGASRSVFRFNQMVDGSPYKANQNHELSLNIITPAYDGSTDSTTLSMMSEQGGYKVIMALPQDGSYLDEIRSILKIESYMRHTAGMNLSRQEEIRVAKSNELRDRGELALIYLKEALAKALFYVNGNELQPTSKDITTRINEVMVKLADTVYNKHYYMNSPKSEEDIRSCLQEDQRQKTLSLNLEAKENELSLNEFSTQLKMMSMKRGVASLKDLIERFRKSPYGFSEYDVEWLAARLYKEGEISLTLNNEVLILTKQGVNNVVRYLTRNEYQPKLILKLRQKADEKQKKLVKEVMDTLFHAACSTNDDDEMMSLFMTKLNELMQEINQRFAYYNRSELHYPGKSSLDTLWEQCKELRQCADSQEFFAKVSKMNENLLNSGEDVEPVLNFFKSEQHTIWQDAQNWLKIYEASRSLIHNEKMDQYTSQIADILRQPHPYAQIKKLPDLLKLSRELYHEEVKEKKKPVYEYINNAKKRVLEAIGEDAKAAHFIGKCERTFESVTNSVSQCTDIAYIPSFQVKADHYKVELLTEISTYKRAQAQKQAQSEQKPMPIKKSKVISIRELNHENTWHIENEADIERYLDMLRKQLKQQIKEEVLLDIEF